MLSPIYTICRFHSECDKPECAHFHFSPADDYFLPTKICSYGHECSNRMCMRWHPSPAFVGGSKGPGQKFRVPCKLANCVKPSCPFLHFSPANQYQRPTAFREMHGLIREECKDGSACTSKGCCYWHPSPEAAKSADDKCSSTPSGFTPSPFGASSRPDQFLA